MTVLHKLLWRYTAHLPFREITDNGVPYLQRYWVGRRKGKNYYLHLFVGSDPARGLHTHKWFAWSLVLVGWYMEQRRWGYRKISWFNRIDPDTAHRVVLPKDYNSRYKGAYCWTLFFHHSENDFPDWGFEREVEGHPGARLYVPYDYAKEGDKHEWWLTAKCRPREMVMPT